MELHTAPTNNKYPATRVMLASGLSPEDGAMLQALYSRSSESVETHFKKVQKAGSGKFMEKYYIGYNHPSIGDCGTITLFIENVSLLAAKAIQDTPLYSGQETSTRYIEMTNQPFFSHTILGMKAFDIQDRWLRFYKENLDQVNAHVRFQHAIKKDESIEAYNGAIKARTFDIMRGFLPAGILTQLSWHGNMRQIADHLIELQNHPLDELRQIGNSMMILLKEKYPTSFSRVYTKEQCDWYSRSVANSYKVFKSTDKQTAFIDPVVINQLSSDDLFLLNNRPRGCKIHHSIGNKVLFNANMTIDFGSFRDIQRHRNRLPAMPILDDSIGFEKWYIEQLPKGVADEARMLIQHQCSEIRSLNIDPLLKQYYYALGFQVHHNSVYPLDAMVYLLEMRSGKTVHPTLRRKTHQWVQDFTKDFPMVRLYVDTDPDDWTVRRGLQTIREKQNE